MITKRQQNLVKILLDSQDYITASKLSQMMNVSSKTIRNEIKVLNNLMSHFAIVQSIPSRGLQLEILNSQEFEDWLNSFYQKDTQMILSNPLERAYYILGLMLEKQEFIKIDDISNMLYVDRTSISRSLKYIRECLEVFGLQIIQKTGKGLMITGNEFRYRLCMVEYIYHKPGMFATEVGENEGFIQELKEVIFNDGLVMPERVFLNFIIHVQVQLDRIKLSQSVSFAPNEIQSIQKEYEFLVAQDVSKIIYKYFNIQLSLEEQCYLAIHILGKKSNSTSAIESCVNDQLKEEISVVVDRVFDRIEKVFHIDFHKDMYLKKAIGLHIYPMENRLRYNTYSRNPLLNTIKERYMFAYILAIESWKELASYTDYIKVEDEIGYIAIHFQYALERRKRNMTKKKVLLVNEYNVALGEFLNFSILKKYRDSLVIEKTIAAGELDNYKLEKYDYIITTVPITKKLPIPVIQIQPIMTQSDFRLLKSYFRRNDLIHLKYFLKKSHIFIEDLESKKEILNYLMKKEQICKDLYEDDKLLGFETNLQIAIYYIPVVGKKSTISVYSLKKAVVWDNKLIKNIFVLKLGYDSESVLESLQSYIINPSNVEKLYQADSKDKIYEILCTKYNK